MPDISLSQIITENLILLKANPSVTSDYKCMSPKVDYTTGADTTTEVYCVQACTGVSPVQSNPSPNFCYHVYHSSLFEKLTSVIASLPNYIDETVRGFTEYSFCSPDTIDSNSGSCPVPVLGLQPSLKGCRPDGRGVWTLPPGEVSCLIFINGHDWPVGGVLTFATSFAATSTLVAGGLAMGLRDNCLGPFYCRAGNRCCLLVPSNRGLQCPSSC